MNIFIFGAGAWGLALGSIFAISNKVFMISRRKLDLDSLNFSDVKRGNLVQIDHFQCHKFYDENTLCVITIASAFMREFIQNATFLHDIKDDAKVLCASKGIEINTGAFMSDILGEVLNLNNFCYLSGPSFAKEVRERLPCALTLHTNNESLGQIFASIFPKFIKPYVKDDIIGAEIAGAYKNVIAIAGGICDGLSLGNNAKASLLARGLVEMARFGEHFGAKIETFLGLSGSGDLFLTSNSTMSRNYRVGFSLAKNKTLSDILKDLGEVAEGVGSARAIYEISQKRNLYTPIATQIYHILNGKNVLESLKELLSRN